MKGTIKKQFIYTFSRVELVKLLEVLDSYLDISQADAEPILYKFEYDLQELIAHQLAITAD